jgi:hypothetical protein
MRASSTFVSKVRAYETLASHIAFRTDRDPLRRILLVEGAPFKDARPRRARALKGTEVLSVVSSLSLWDDRSSHRKYRSSPNAPLQGTQTFLG